MTYGVFDAIIAKIQKTGVVSQKYTDNLQEIIMKTFTLIAMLVFASFLTSCTQQDSTVVATSNTATKKPVQDNPVSKEDKEWDYKFKKENKSISVSSEDFNALVKFIETKGFPVGDGEKQYTYFDSHKNRHAMIAIKRGDDNKPSPQGKVVQISVWAYDKGIKDQEHFFGYAISPEDGVFSLIDSAEYNDKHFSKIEFGYKEFLEKAKKSS